MNREIKFRAFDTKSRKWLTEVPCLEYLLDDPDAPVSHHDVDMESGSYFYPLSPMGPTFGGRIIYVEYTGLKDQNGQGIYEGDIISCEERMMDGMPDFKRPISVVIWDGCSWCYSLDKGRGWKNPHQILRFALNVEIIGNIFENPELLK